MRSRPPSPRLSQALRSYLQGFPAAGSTLLRAVPAPFRLWSSRPPMPRLGKAQEPASPRLQRNPGSELPAAPWGLERLWPWPLRVGLCPHLSGAHQDAARAPASASRRRRALGLLLGSGQLALARMALRLAAAPGRGLGPPAAPATVFVSRPAPRRHGLAGSKQRGPGSRRRRIGFGFPIVARPGRARRQGARAATARTRRTEGAGPRGARQRRRGGAELEAAAGESGMGAPPELGKGDLGEVPGPGAALGENERRLRAGGSQAARAASGVLVSPLPYAEGDCVPQWPSRGERRSRLSFPGALGSQFPGLRLCSLLQGQGSVVASLIDFTSWLAWV